MLWVCFKWSDTITRLLKLILDKVTVCLSEEKPEHGELEEAVNTMSLNVLR